MMPPTLQALRDAARSDAVIGVVCAHALNWVDAGCPTLAPETAALLTHLRDGDSESNDYYRAYRAWRAAGCPGASAPKKEAP